jgi:hypothetical protein
MVRDEIAHHLVGHCDLLGVVEDPKRPLVMLLISRSLGELSLCRSIPSLHLRQRFRAGDILEP